MNPIKELMKRKGVSQKELALTLGVSQPTISDWVQGKKKPTDDNAIKIAEFFGVSKEAVLGIEPIASNVITINQTRLIDAIMKRMPSATKRIPIIGDTAAGQPIIADRIYDEYITVPTDGQKFDAAVRVKGDSMEPNYRIGDLALIRYQEDVSDGQIAVVCLDDEVTLKRVYHDKDGIILISDNRKYPPMKISHDDISNIHLTGRAIGVIHWEE